MAMGVARRAGRSLANRAAQAVGGSIAGLLRGTPKPPPCQFSKIVPYVTRYTMGSDAAAGVTVADLLDSFFVGSTSTVGYRVFSAVKIKKVEIWGPAYTSAAPLTVNFTWYNNSAGQEVGAPGVNVTDTSIAFNDNAHICTVPPKNSLAAMWLSAATNSDPIFALYAPQFSVIDIHMVGVIAEGTPNGGSPQIAIARAVSGAGAGVLYQSYLPPTSTQGLVPIMGNVI